LVIKRYHLGNSVQVLGSTTYEIDTNGGDITFRIGIIGKTEQKTGLSNTGVTNKKKLEEIIATDDKSKRH
jgi:hypothetical protein